MKKLVDALTLQLDTPAPKVASNGAVLLGNRSDIGPLAFTHVLFPGLTESTIQEVVMRGENHLPSSYICFLLECNGAILFQGALSLFGIRNCLSRNLENRQPFDIIGLNDSFDRPRWSTSSGTVIGSYDYDGSLLYMTAESEVVSRRSADSGQVFNAWSNLSIFIQEEIVRLGALHDGTGKPIDPSVPTTPKACSSASG